MNKRLTAIMMAAAMMMVVACSETKPDNEKKGGSAAPLAQVGDTTVYGHCADAAMHSLALTVDNADTLYLSLEVMDERSDVLGGILINDKLAVIKEKRGDYDFAKKVINLNTLVGRWVSKARDFDIKENGDVESHVEGETKPYTAWKIFNGKIVLADDTFDIVRLDADTLSLENAEGIYDYTRKLK